MAPAAAPNLPPGHPPIGGAAAAPDVAPPSAPAHALRWKDAPTWTKVTPSSSMRQAQYQVPKVGSDTENGELVVFYFGQGQGGAVDDNIKRWVGQFGDAPGKTEHRTVGTIPVTVVSVEGTFGGGMAMPGAPAPSSRENWALLGAIAETPDGPWFFKLTGPKETVGKARPAFDEFVGSFKVE